MIDQAAARRIRYYIYGLLRRNADQSVPIPSSYKLAEEFGTTRQVVRYELERLIELGLLISKHRVGTFTNPQGGYSQRTRLDGHMPMVGVLYANGDFFSYAAIAAHTLGALYPCLADANCYVHDLRLPKQSEEAMLRDLAALKLDGLIWPGFDRRHASLEFYRQLAELKLPVVTVNGEHPLFDAVELDVHPAARELAERFRREGRKRVWCLRETLLSPGSPKVFAAALTEELGELRTFSGQNLEELVEDFTAALDREPVPDAVLFDGALAKAVPAILHERGISPAACLPVSLADFNGQGEFAGAILHTPFEEQAKLATGMLLEHLAEPALPPRRRSVTAELRFQNVPTT